VSEGTVSPEALAQGLGAGLRLEVEPQRTVHHEWFDTFDWRLHRASLILERVAGSGREGAQLLLRDAAEQLLLVAPDDHPRAARTREPEAFPLNFLVPAGPMRARLAPVVQMRALLPLARVASRVSTIRAVDAQAKTVARILLEQTLGESGRRPTPISRVRVVPVRGYENRADRVARRLAALPGLRPSAGGWLLSALAEIGRQPGDNAGPPDLKLEAPMATGAVVQALMGQLLAAAERNVPGVEADLDTEFLHDLRVAVRRARSALKLLGDALPVDVVGRLTLDLKWMGDLTTPTRDLDAYLLAIGAAEVAGEDDDLLPYHAFLRSHRRKAHRALVRGLGSVRWARTCQRWSDLATADPEALGGSAVGSRPFGEVAPPRIARSYRRATQLGERITSASPATDLHALRKRCKELRYLLEFSRSMLDGSSYRTVIVQLKALQDCLGEFQDTQVQGAAIDAFAEEMMVAGGTSAATIMAMGRASDALQARQGQARALFARRFSGFANRGTRTRVAELSICRPGLERVPFPEHP
jgi:CHAD domain-containing protein